MRKSTLVLTLIGLLVIAGGALYVLTLDLKPRVELTEKVFPDERFPR